MFKRVDKRRRKKEEEEELGLDEEVKEILGIQDTDSEESESDSDEGEEEKTAADEEMNSVEDEDDEEDDDKQDSSITVSQALKDPLYIVSILPDVKACIVCPGKLLKSVKMVQLHRTSNAHIRRFKQFSDSSADAKPNDNAWNILKRNSETKPKLSLTTSGVSKRAEKKKASQARGKARREEAKEKAKARKAKAPKATSENTPAQPSDTPRSTNSKSPPKKKRKIDILPSAAPSLPKHDKKEGLNTKPAPASATAGALCGIQDIVKSASSRAKTARSRALSMSKSTSRPTKSAVA